MNPGYLGNDNLDCLKDLLSVSDRDSATTAFEQSLPDNFYMVKWLKVM